MKILDNIDCQKYNVDLLVMTKYGELINEANKNVNVKYVFTPIKSNNKKIIEFYKKINRKRPI